MDDRDLEEAFTKFGRINKVWIARTPPGFGFVEYEDERDAEDAIKEMDNKCVRLRIAASTARAREEAGTPASRSRDVQTNTPHTRNVVGQ